MVAGVFRSGFVVVAFFFVFFLKKVCYICMCFNLLMGVVYRETEH